MTTVATHRQRVRTDRGALVGIRAGGITRFLGVPYAAPPRGAARFAPPRPAAAWRGDRPALVAGASAPQPGSIRARLVLGDSPPPGDDCLVLNVWSPDLDAGLPVLCWVHGGGFTNGSGAVPALDGSALAAAGLVVVTVNYRLGMPGFAHHPALTGEGGNHGLDDVGAAVAWVGRNAAAFGGDPARITLAGDSAGAVCVGLVAATRPDLPIARLALHSAIPATMPAPDAVERVERIAAVLGRSVADLVDVPSGRLVAAAAGLGPHGRLTPAAVGPLERGLDAVPGPALPTLITTTADDGTFFFVDERSPRVVREEEAIRMLDLACGDGERRYLSAAASAPVGLRDEPHRVFGRAYARARVEEPADRYSTPDALRAPVWRARYERPATVWDGWLGATHTLDVLPTFGTHRAPALGRLHRGDEGIDQVALDLRAHLVRFVEGGAPRDGWPRWLPDHPHVEALGHDPRPARSQP